MAVGANPLRSPGKNNNCGNLVCRETGYITPKNDSLNAENDDKPVDLGYPIRFLRQAHFDDFWMAISGTVSRLEVSTIRPMFSG